MAWDPLDDDAYSGDLPMDAFGTALARAAEVFEATENRRPYTSEVAEALLAAIRAAAEGTIGQRDRADELLAPWIALPRIATKTKRPRATAGDILAIPYAGDGAKQICGRVLFAPTKQQRGPGYGLCVVVHDLDLTASGTDAAAIRSEPILLGPFHVGDEEILEGRWRIVGRVDPDDAELPTFASSVADGQGGWRPRVTDYFGTELADTPEHRARLVEQSIGPPSTLIIMIRMLRGLVRWLPSYAKCFGVRKP